MGHRDSAKVKFNPHVSALPAYNAGLSLHKAQQIAGRSDIARMASNENFEGCSPRVIQALGSGALEPWRYCDPACEALRAALSRHLNVPADQLVVGNGSEELIAAVSRAALTPSAQVVTVVPSFGLHEIEPLAAGASVLKIPMTEDLGFDIDRIEAAMHKSPQLVFLSSPWNPVGPALSREQLERLMTATRPETLFVLDEAYHEYADPEIPDGIDLLRKHDVAHVVLRTFSKAYGLAGLRVGYAVCSDADVARVVGAAKTPFNVNSAAQIAAMAALEDQAWMKASVRRLRTARTALAEQLNNVGLRVAPSHTNFLFVDIKADSAGVASRLLAQGIIVKAWREPGYEQYLRITVGSPVENERLIGALASILKTIEA